MNRLGIVETRNPEETEFRIRKLIEKKYWLSINELFVIFGQKICKPIKPKCIICLLTSSCKWYKQCYPINDK